MGLPSAYYNESHKRWQKTCRALVDELLMPEGGEWEKAGDVPGDTDSRRLKLAKLTNIRGLIPEVRRCELPDTQSIGSSASEMVT